MAQEQHKVIGDLVPLILAIAFLALIFWLMTGCAAVKLVAIAGPPLPPGIGTEVSHAVGAPPATNQFIGDLVPVRLVGTNVYGDLQATGDFQTWQNIAEVPPGAGVMQFTNLYDPATVSHLFYRVKYR